LSLRDRDLISIQEARKLVARAAAAQKKFSAFSQEQVDAVVEACAKAAADNAETLARTAVEETGYGNVPDKIIKNTLAAVEVPRAIRALRTVGILREDREKGIVEVASPVGVVAAVIPCTNPTSTAIYKTLISIKAQNAIVLSPHPAAIKCICQTASLLDRAALTAGAPEGLISCMRHTTLEGTRELMRQHDVGVILATGGTGLVRAAYGSGKPAYGVGPGNVPAFIERTADVRKAVADILAGKTFDYGTICSSEQAIVAEEPVRELALEECRRQGAYFLSPEEMEKVGRLLILPGTHTPNTKIVGRPATRIAEMAGIAVPPATRVLIARLEPEQVGREFPLSAEKLSPILAFYAAPNLAAGIALCRRLLEFGGLGHTCSIHSQNRAAILEFGAAMPAFRVVVNSAAVHGSIGYSTNLFPAMTLGCGSPGGNITSDNIGPQHLMNVKRIAWESRGIEHRTIPADQRMAGVAPLAAPVGQALRPVPPVETPESGASAALAEGVQTSVSVLPDRATIAQVVEHVMTSHGIARGSGAPKSASAAKELPSPSAVAAEIAGRLFRSPGRPKADAAANFSSASSHSANVELPTPPALPPKSEAPPKPVVEISPFVSENDVRRAMTRSEKIFIGPKTILTPSARDLGMEHEVFIETEAGSLR
jgi:acetaldehyde dehydrogenase (acetylating)